MGVTGCNRGGIGGNRGRGAVKGLPVAPKTRGDCESGPRPCPWTSCRYHLLYGEEASRGWRSKLPALEEMKETCALDVANRGSHTLDYVAKLFGLTRERIRQIEEKAIRKIIGRQLFKDARS